MNDLMTAPRKTSRPVPPEPPPPDDDKAERIRLIVDTDEIVRQAVALRAIKLSVQRKRKVTNSEAVDAILRDALASEIKELAAEAPEPRRRQH
jgi:hypothetical protein